MSDYVTDPELLAQLNGQTEAKDEYITDPKLLGQLNNKNVEAVEPEGINPLGAISPAVTAYGMGPSGAGQAGKIVGSAVAPYAKEVLKGYVGKPMTAVADAVLMSGGLPPMVGPAQGFMDRAAAVKQGMIDASKQASMGAETLSPVKGVPTTTTVRPYFDMLKSVPREVADKISDIWNNSGGNNAVKSWLNSAEGQALQKANSQFAANAAKFVEATPGVMSQVGRIVKPLAVGAARVAGPVGNVMLAHDIVDQFAQNKQNIEANPSAPGLESNPYAMQLRGQAPSVAAAGAMNQRAVLSRPTPAPISPQEASNLLQSDDQRTINIYGGRAHLEELVKSGLRQKAASKVLGPVAPGQ